MLEKLLTRPVWQWERHRPYPVRQRFAQLPPIASAPASKRFAVLTTPAALPDALWAAWSWFRFLQPESFELHLAVDGTLPQEDLRKAGSLFPGIFVYDVNTVVEQFCSGRPALSNFMRHHPIAKQVGISLALSCQGAVIYSDHDVCAFNHPGELLDAIDAEKPCYFPDTGKVCHDPSLLEILQAKGIQHIENLNAGFLYIPQNSLPVDLAEEILSPWSPLPRHYFTPQTVMSTLMHAAHAKPLPASRYLISNCRQFYWQKDVDYAAIAARHFTGPVRHVLYKFGMPFLLRQAQQEDPRGAKLKAFSE